MKHHACRSPFRSGKAIVALTPLFIAITVFGVAAQENALGPSDVLQYPVEASSTAALGAAGAFLRYQIETATDLSLCQVLMTAAGRSIPANFSASDCTSEFADKVRNNEGIVHWADNARPLQCGSNCFGRPFMSRTQLLDRPNVRRAMLYGSLNFVLDGPGPANRDLTYFYEIHFTCKTVNGARNGDFVVDVEFGNPIIGDPGTFEAVFDFLLPINLSRSITAAIRRELPGVPGQTTTLNPCQSVGVYRPTNPLFDMAVYDLPPSAGPRMGRSDIGAATTLRDTATIHFLRIVRKPLPGNVDDSYAELGNPAAGHFNVFINGSLASFPPIAPTPTGAIDLPPEGGSVELNYCRTVDLTGSDRLQLLFTNGLGGAVWSQFARTDGFGATGAKTLTTGRSIVVPGHSGPPDPVTGRPRPVKPESVMLREFELLYTITYSKRPDAVATTEPARPGRRPDVGAITDALGDRPSVAVDPSAPAPQPCRKI